MQIKDGVVVSVELTSCVFESEGCPVNTPCKNLKKEYKKKGVFVSHYAT